MNTANNLGAVTARAVEDRQEKQEKRVFFMILLGFISVGGGVSVYFGGLALSSLAGRPNASLYSGVASVGSMFFSGGDDEEIAKPVKPNPFEEPRAFFNDTSGASAQLAGAVASVSMPGGRSMPASGAYASGNGMSGDSKLAGALSGVGAAGSGSKVSGNSLSGGNNASRNGEGFSVGAPGDRGDMAKLDAKGRGTLSALNNAAKVLYGSALSKSAQDKRAAGALVYDGADKSKAGAEASFSGALTKLDSVNSSANDLKMNNPNSLKVPDVGKPKDDASASAEANALAGKDALKKAMDPTNGLVSPGMGGVTDGLSSKVQDTGKSSPTTSPSATGSVLSPSMLSSINGFQFSGDKTDTAYVTCNSPGNCVATFKDGFQMKMADGKLVATIEDGKTFDCTRGECQPSNYTNGGGSSSSGGTTTGTGSN